MTGRRFGFVVRLCAAVAALALVSLGRTDTATAAVDKVTLVSPADGTALSTLALDLRWELPTGATQLTLQVVPAQNDGPGVDLLLEPSTSYTLPAPAFGTGPYVMLPGMSYQWRVRASDATTSLGQQDPAWGPWSDWWSFKTPAPSSGSITAASPATGSRIAGLATTSLQWTDAAIDIFYYELQLSTDSAFGENGPRAAVYHNLLHGALASPPNSWTTPPLAANATYFWRLRSRVQGDGTPVAWSTVFSFTTDGGKYGGRIVFASNRDGDENLHLYSMAANGSDIVRLTDGPQGDTSPVWAPDGSRIAFSSNRDNSNWDIYTMDPDGANVVRLTSNAAIDRDPNWSPDGKKIAFISLRDGGEAVWVMTATGGQQTRLTSPTSGAGRPTWSPDSKRIAFSSRRGPGGTAEIVVMNADGSAQHSLTDDASADLYPAWSPNGEWIAFSSVRAGSWEVYVMRSDGSAPALVSSGGDNLYPAWSHDSSRLMFASGRHGNGNWEIYQINFVDGQVTRLTDHPRVDTAPAPSPS